MNEKEERKKKKKEEENMKKEREKKEREKREIQAVSALGSLVCECARQREEEVLQASLDFTIF